MGQGLQVEPSVVSVAVLQVSQRRQRWGATADIQWRCGENSLRKWRMAPRQRSLAGKLWNGSRALGRALGCLRRGPTAGAMAMKVDAMVAQLDLVKIKLSSIITQSLIRVVLIPR